MEYLGPGAEGVSPQAAAGIFVERLKTGDLGDRRDALDALLKLSEDHATAVGSTGMPVFTDILQAGIADHSMTQTIMGIMLNLVAERDGETGTGANVEAFLKDVQNVQNLLDLLSSKDVLTSLSAVQVRCVRPVWLGAVVCRATKSWQYNIVLVWTMPLRTFPLSPLTILPWFVGLYIDRHRVSIVAELVLRMISGGEFSTRCSKGCSI